MPSPLADCSLLLALALTASCGRESSPARTEGAAAAVPSPPPIGGELAKDLTESAARVAAQRLLDRWVGAQNAGDIAAYLALYDSAHFQGVRRTSKGIEKRMDFAGWRSDRERLFSKAQQVAVEASTIETGHSGNLDKSLVTVAFTQRWRSGIHSDHGKKVLTLRVSRLDAPVIVREELLTASAGWEEARDVKVLDATALASPIVAQLLWILELHCAQADPGKLCSKLVFQMTGAHKEHLEIALIEEATNPDVLQGGGSVEPSAHPPLLFELRREYSVAAPGESVRIVWDGGGITVQHDTTDEGGPPAFADYPDVLPDEYRVTISAGAKVIARK